MPQKDLGRVFTVKAAVQAIIPYLVDTGRSAHKAIYFDGFCGLAASAVLRAIAEDPPQSLINKFDRIIHIDCSRWKSRRALQKAIAHELKLPRRVMAAFRKQDKEDDFSGVDEDSRAEIAVVTREIYQTVRDLRCLLIFHNGSNSTIDLSNFGFLQFDWFSPYTVLWTFRGRLRLNPKIKEKVDNSHLYLHKNISLTSDYYTRKLIKKEAKEIAKYIPQKNNYMTPEIASKCVSYLLWLNKKGGNTMDYNWATHASNYWVCDGIFGNDQNNYEIWEVSAALHKQIKIEECTSDSINIPDDDYYKVHWMSASDEEVTSLFLATPDDKEVTPPTSLFLAKKNGVDIALPHEMFQQLKTTLHVLKLSWCRFSFCSPPFQYCRGLRFLGLHHCQDQGREGEHEQGRPVIDFFQNLWVLDISHMDWEFDLSQVLEKEMALNIREIHIKKGSIWRSHLAWRQLQMLHKLRVIDPTSSWETGKKDEFTDMVKLEHLDLSNNSTIQVLPSLSSATCLRTLVLDGCVGLDHVGPEGLPPALEIFSLDANSDKLSKISLSGCARLKSFLLHGQLLGLEELNLSSTSVRRVDLSDKVVQVQGLKKVFLMACKQLRAILWWEGERQLEVLRIGTLEAEDTHPYHSVSDPSHIQNRNYVVTGDLRIIQSLLIREDIYERDMIARSLYLDVHKPPAGSSRKSKGPSRDKIIPTPCSYADVLLYQDVHIPPAGSSRKSKGPSRDKIIPTTCSYTDVLLEGDCACDNEMKRHPLLDHHMEIGPGISLTNVESDKGIQAIEYVMLKHINSLHVHDNSCIIDVTPKLSPKGYHLFEELRWCRVESCPKLQAVFGSHQSKSHSYGFPCLNTIWASDLLTAACIWRKGSIEKSSQSFGALETIHLHNCPRLKFVLPLSRYTYLPRLETLHITQCGDLRQVFPWDAVNVPRQHRMFPKLKYILLRDLFNLREISEANMTAPMLESIMIRGCWNVRRLPALGQSNSLRRPVVDCEKTWWAKLEWDGLHAGHHPSLYEPHSSAYYMKRHLRCTVLR